MLNKIWKPVSLCGERLHSGPVRVDLPWLAGSLCSLQLQLRHRLLRDALQNLSQAQPKRHQRGHQADQPSGTKQYL